MKESGYIILTLLCLMLSSCHREELSPETGLTGEEAWAVIPFSSKAGNSVEAGTKATLGIIPESRVLNIFLYIFVDGKRVYAHFFDNRNLATESDAMNSRFDAWWCDNSIDASDPLGDYSGDESRRTHGGLRIKAPQVLDGKAEIYAIANIDGDMLNISPEKLTAVQTKADLLKLTAHMNQATLSRNGYFTMTAFKDNLTIQGGVLPVLHNGSKDWKLEFVRMDAKVEVFVRTALDYELVKERKDGAGADTLQRLKAFVPESWQVFNVPVGCNLIEQASDSDAAEAEGYFNSEPVNFDDTESKTFTYKGKDYTADVHNFSFYMMENREAAKSSVGGNYHLRDLRTKTETGTYTATSGDMWVYAPANGTYVVMKGEVQMEVEVSSEAKKQTLVAEATYVFHLGDFGTNTDNYDVFRNTIYTYTITICGVNKIELEVVTSNRSDPSKLKEENTGAMGSVSLARESSYTFDAHFGQRVFSFDAASIDKSNTYWYVKTPFGKEGIPPRIGGKDVPAGYDYEWVKFKVNKVCTEEDVKNDPYKESYDKYGVLPYKRNNQPYPGDDSSELMNIVELTEYLQQERDKMELDAEGYLKQKDPANPSAFRDEYDQEWYDWTFLPSNSTTDNWSSGGGRTGKTDEDKLVAEKNAHRYRIYVTCYVNEFFYEKDPVTGGAVPQDYWKQFCNQPNRMMFLLCDSHFSLDGDSSATGAVIVIRQRAIQTPYNLERASLKTAWGTEVIDETEGLVWYYNRDESNKTRILNDSERAKWFPLEVTTRDNGLYNTVSNWQMLDGGTFKEGERWDEHLDYEALNDANYVFLKDDENNATMRWSCLMRNRDENGNGVIDPEEVKWYMASTNQVHELYFGSLGLTEDAMLFSRAWTRKPTKYDAGVEPDKYFGNVDLWRRHVITSTINYQVSTSVDPLPDMVRVEEGITTDLGGYKLDLTQDDSRKFCRYTTRCLRNLGMPDATAGSIGDKEQNIPEKIISAKFEYSPGDSEDKRGIYTFDCNNINEKSLRYKTSRELEPMDEFGESARMYKGFQTGPYVELPGAIVNGNEQERAKNYDLLYDTLLAGSSPCPEGYRVPNIREVTAMFLYATNSKWWAGETMTSTYFSAGYQYGNGKDYLSTKLDAEKYKYSWTVQSARITISIGGWGNYYRIRCVKDYDPE